ncbi:uncharacterized protein V6R79_018742 [Siganus canaliculatus]
MEGKGRASACFSWLNDDNPPELWHSTPVKQKHGPAKLDVSHQSVRTGLEMDSRTQQWAKSPTGFPSRTVCSPRSEETRRFPVSDLSSSTVQRQRTELQLLMAELKDREQELNVMAAAHRKQLHAWEQDRQRVLASEQRCSGLDDELQKRNEVMAVLTKRVIAVETREEEIQKELSAARLQLRELQQKQQHASQKCDDYQEKNQSLSSTIMALSAQVGALQVREEELSSMLKLKDKDVTEASAHVAHLTGRLQDLEAALAESRSRESKVLRESEENRRRYRDAKHDAARLKEELQQQVSQGSAQREEIIRLKQELQLLHRDLLLSEGDSWKDELLELARSKQERTSLELQCLRQVCENQHNDLQLLQMNLESSRETRRENTSLDFGGSQDKPSSSSSAGVKKTSPSRGGRRPLAAPVEDVGQKSPSSVQVRPVSSGSLPLQGGAPPSGSRRTIGGPPSAQVDGHCGWTCGRPDAH